MVAIPAPLTDGLPDAALWDMVEEDAKLLGDLLRPEQRGQPHGGLPYWFVLGHVVGRLTTTTRELSKRAAIGRD